MGFQCLMFFLLYSIGISLLQSSSWNTRNVSAPSIQYSKVHQDCAGTLKFNSQAFYIIILIFLYYNRFLFLCAYLSIGNCDKSSSKNLAGSPCINETTHDKRPKACQKRQKLPCSQSEYMLAAGCSLQKDADCNKKSDCLMGGFSLNTNISKLSSIKDSSRCISIDINYSRLCRLGSSDGPANAHGSNVSSIFSKKRSVVSEDGYDPFAFDGDELVPSKWEALARNRKTTRNHQSRKRDKEPDDKLKHMLTITSDNALKEEPFHGSEDLCISAVHKSSDLLEECLLTAVKVTYDWISTHY